MTEATPAPESAEEKPAKKTAPAKPKELHAPAPVADAVVTNADRDPIYLSKAEFKNKSARKSLTVHHIQRRLNVLGYDAAYADMDGWYGDLTFEGVKSFQSDKGLDATGLMDWETFTALFDGDPNVDPRM